MPQPAKEYLRQKWTSSESGSTRGITFCSLHDACNTKDALLNAYQQLKIEHYVEDIVRLREFADRDYKNGEYRQSVTLKAMATELEITAATYINLCRG
jgi:hypothetical protein